VNCNNVSHLLSAYMDGELLGYEHRQIHHHLQQCVSCREEYESLLQLKRLLGALSVREPGRAFADEMLQRVSAEKPKQPAAPAVLWHTSLKGYRSRAAAYSPMIGLGVGLTVAGLLFLAQLRNTTVQRTSAQRTLTFELANISHDEPPPVGELTNGLTHEAAPQPVVWEPQYPDDLPGSPLETRRASKSRANAFPALFVR
jgi:anti-sigma factor RsiW